MIKKNTILTKLYQKSISKDDFATIFGLKSTNTRSVENYISDTNQYIQKEDNIENLIDLNEKEIIYDKSLKKYRFNTLLPNFISYGVLISYLGETINNTIFAEDFKTIKHFSSNNECIKNLELIKTSTLSTLMQKIIQFKLSLQLNYSLKIEYKKNGKSETKYINPHSLINSGGIHYLYATYHTDNISNIGEYRTFALSGIISIVAKEISTEKLFEKAEGNAWGAYDENNFVLLKLKGKAANFYKREGFQQSSALTFVSEEPDESIQVKMLYAHEQNIVNFIQKWMPFATIAKDSELKERIFGQIKDNYINLVH